MLSPQAAGQTARPKTARIVPRRERGGQRQLRWSAARETIETCADWNSAGSCRPRATPRPMAWRARRSRRRLPLFDRVVEAAEAAGFEYMLVPVQTACWEAWISSAMMVARSKSIRMLVAARPSYINPVLLAKMIATFDQLSGGRICINLIAGQSEAENASEGITLGQGRALRDHGRGGLDPEGAVDDARPGELRRQVLSVEGRADPALSAAEAPSEILSRRRLEAGLGDLGQALRRASLLGRHLRAHPRQHGRDPRHGRAPRPRERHRLRHAPADRLPADREGGVGIRA